MLISQLPVRTATPLNVQSNCWSGTGVEFIELAGDFMFRKPIILNLKKKSYIRNYLNLQIVAFKALPQHSWENKRDEL